MKILHTADIHLGAKNSRLPVDKQSIIKSESLMLIQKFFEDAYKDDYDVILICGDLFHSKNITMKIKNVFFNSVRDFSRPVIYIKGNHDEKFEFLDLPENFIILDKEKPFVKIDKTIFWSIEQKDELIKNFSNLNQNVLLLHGNIENHTDNDFININEISNIPFDYVAMGHIHQFKEYRFADVPYVYSGSLFSNGFDECEQKGYICVDIEDKKTSYHFVPFSKRSYKICESDITMCKNQNDIFNKIKEDLKNSNCHSNDLVKLVIKGYFDENMDKNINLILDDFRQEYFYFEIEDKSKLKIDLEKYKNEKLSFKAEFINLVENVTELDEKQKSFICQLGIEALKGEDLSI